MDTENLTNLRKDDSLIRWAIKAALWCASMWRRKDEVGERAEKRLLESRLDPSCEWS